MIKVQFLLQNYVQVQHLTKCTQLLSATGFSAKLQMLDANTLNWAGVDIILKHQHVFIVSMCRCQC